MDTLRKVMCAIDLGWEGDQQDVDSTNRLPLLDATAEGTLRAAAHQAALYGADLAVLHALPMDPGAPMSPEAVEAAMLKRQELANLIIDAVLEALEHLTGRAPEDVPVLVEDGPADSAIVAAADRQGADLIVVGHIGAKGLGDSLLGSVASAVTRQARCSVLVVRPRDARRS
jgi:nucleotide-binding universal stress UspA family protein